MIFLSLLSQISIDDGGFFSSPLFAYIILFWLGLLTIVLGIIIINLLNAQSAVQSTLVKAIYDLNSLANETINYTVCIDQIVPIEAEVAINKQFLVPVSLSVSHTVIIDEIIPFRDNIIIPIHLEIDEILPIETTFHFKDEFIVPIDEIIPINDEFTVAVKLPLYGRTVLDVPARANVRVKLDANVPIEKDLHIQANIPVKLPVSELIEVKLDQKVPVKLEIPIIIPVETEAVVDFNQILPVKANVPLRMDVPVDIDLKRTPLGKHLLSLSQALETVATVNKIWFWFWDKNDQK